MNGMLLEYQQVKKGALGDATSGLTGARFDLSKCERVAILVEAASADTDLTVSFQEHTAASGGTSADLTIVSDYFTKEDAETYFTRVEQDSDSQSNSYTFTGANGAVACYVFDIKAEDLSDGYTHISCNIGAAARVVSVHYVSKQMKYMPAYSEVV